MYFVIGCDVDQYNDGANGDSNIMLTSALKIMDKNVELQLNNVKDGSIQRVRMPFLEQTQILQDM